MTSDAFKRIEQGLKEALAFAQGARQGEDDRLFARRDVDRRSVHHCVADPQGVGRER